MLDGNNINRDLIFSMDDTDFNQRYDVSEILAHKYERMFRKTILSKLLSWNEGNHDNEYEESF